MYFKDRAEAGKELAKALKKYKNKDAVVYALPRGGVALGFEIASELKLPLDIVIPRKIGHPMNPEYAIAAITEHGAFAGAEFELSGLDPDWLQERMQKEKEEAERRREVYMAGRKPFPAKGKIAILVDDGIATGLTMEAAILDIREQDPASIVVAIPVTPRETAERLKKMVHDWVVLDAPQFYLGAVGAYYASFPQITDEEVIQMLERVNPRIVAGREV